MSTATVVCYCTENGHTNAVRTEKAATCLEKGIEATYCSVCDEVLDLTETSLGSHNYVNSICTVCGELLKGDLDGDGKVNSIDSNIIKRIVLGLINSDELIKFADMNDDGKVNSIDCALLKRKIMGMGG